MSEICVAHLVRAQNGLATFQRFIESYRAYPPGTSHTLLLILKGFDERRDLRDYESLLDGIPYESFFVEDQGFDIRPYLSAARNFKHRYFCFLNSFSVILDEGWLLKMYQHIQSPGVGVVAATGSYESLYDHLMRSWPQERPWSFWLKIMLRHPADFRRALSNRAHFPPFPDYHVRTNAFMIAREIMLRLKIGEIRSKDEAHRFESGRRGMTRQILAMNLKPLVVGRDGRAYEMENWYESVAFRSGDQHNLLVADNQTRYYDNADPEVKKALAEWTWRGR